MCFIMLFASTLFIQYWIALMRGSERNESFENCLGQKENGKAKNRSLLTLEYLKILV